MIKVESLGIVMSLLAWSWQSKKKKSNVYENNKNIGSNSCDQG
jgi:hypothetical protein